MLAEYATANAVAYSTPAVATSTVITRTEPPVITERIDRKDGLFLVPVAAGGADNANLSKIAGAYLGTHR